MTEMVLTTNQKKNSHQAVQRDFRDFSVLHLELVQLLLHPAVVTHCGVNFNNTAGRSSFMLLEVSYSALSGCSHIEFVGCILH